jgi:S1-C subfamily serine protease
VTFVAIAIVVLASFVVHIYTYQLFSSNVRSLENEIASLRTQISALSASLKDFNYTSFGNVSLSQLYLDVKESVVLIRGGSSYHSVAGSGFVLNYSGQFLICTNYHVVEDTNSLSVTFSNGSAYAAHVLGTDPYVDFAVLAVDGAPVDQFHPLPIVSSSLLNVGEMVIALGNPYELVGSMTTGIVSQLGRAIPETLTGGYAIANVIQISAPINPGNSGGPLLNSKGQVVGMTFAIIENSTGVGFAIPSDTILREISWLVNGDQYPHSWIGIMGRDMTYELSEELGSEATYGWGIVDIIAFSPASRTDLRVHDIILAINETQIINGDALSSYLEDYTMPDQTITILVERDRSTLSIPLTLGTRPPPD